MGIMKTPFTDAVEAQVPKGTGTSVPHLPSGSGSPIDNCAFKDALEDHVPNGRTGGVLPEHTMETGIKTPATGLGSVPTPGEKFKIG